MAASEKTFVSHLEELRKRLWVCLAALGLCVVGAFAYAETLLEFLAQPMMRVIPEVYYFSPADAFIVKMKVSFLAGLLAASPVLFAQFWGFVSPALYPQEKKSVVPLALVTSFFFITGALFAFYRVIPLALGFFLGQGTSFLKPMISMTEYISFLSGMTVAFGLAFNLPVVVVGLVALGIVKVKTLNQFQKHAIVLIFIASAILTPTPDIASQLLLAAPLLVLFEGSMAVSWVVERLRVPKAKSGCDA